MRDWDGQQDLWLFGYGSLIWNPGCRPSPRCAARCTAITAGLYLWSRVNRGTPERRASCSRSIAAAPARASRSGSPARPRNRTSKRCGSAKCRWPYRPAWLPCSLESGERVNALAFVMRRDAPTYTGKLTDPVVKEVFSCAAGRYGTTLDYVSRTVDALRASGIPDRALEGLLARCR